MTLTVVTADELAAHVGRTLHAPITVTLDRALISQFCALSGDHQWIHRSDENAIVPGNLLISLIPRFIQSTLRVQHYSRCVTASYERIRFMQQVPVDQSVGMSVNLVSVNTRRSKTYVKLTCQLKVEQVTHAVATLTDVYIG